MKDFDTGLTAEYLRSALAYDPETGIFIWKWRKDMPDRVNSCFAGHIAGCTHKYVHVRINGHLYRGHRLAVFYTTGAWPPKSTDHKNRTPSDNRLDNLRPATQSQNGANRSFNKNNKLRLKGVCWSNRDQAFRSTINVDRKQQSLGYFDCPAAAHLMYVIAADKIFGEFSRAN